MSEIIGVRFKEGGKIYYFRPNDEQLDPGCHVVVETVRGTECGEVVMGRREIDDSEFTREVKTVIRKATDADLVRLKENKIKARKAFDICNQKIKAHGLEMNLLEVECTFDNSKIVFNFSAEGRVDFRELVKDLASVFRARIELRQIGVRDEAKMLGGLGVCGRPFCCKQFMGDFQSVSIKMAKDQGLSLNPVKISGTCGRLMCCLKHEQDAYEDLMRTMPQVGSAIVTPEGPGVIVDRELIAGKVKVRLDGVSEAPPKTFRVSEVHRPGEAPPAPSAAEQAADDSDRRNDGLARKTDGYGRKNDGNVRKNDSGRKPDSAAGKRNDSAADKKPDSAAAKKNPDYQYVDFEESLSGGSHLPDDFTEDIRPSRKPNRSRHSGRRPERRSQNRKSDGEGRPPEPREEKPQTQPQREPRQGGGEPKQGNGKPRHNRGKPNYNKKNGGKKPE